MNKKDLKFGYRIISDSGQLAFVDKILPTKVRVIIDRKKDYILDGQLFHWNFANPIIDNRLVSSYTFAVRFKQFLKWIPKEWWMSQPHYYEEYEYMELIADELLNYQIHTATDENEIEYLKRLELL